MRTTDRFTLDDPPERVAEVLCSESFNIERDTSREDVVSSEYVLIEDSEREKRFETHLVEYKRTMTGRIDRKGTTRGRLEYHWRADDMRLSWTYRDEKATAPVELRGTYHLSPNGAGTRLVHDVDIDVHVPLIGKRVAKMIAGEFEEAAPRYRRLLKKHLESTD